MLRTKNVKSLILLFILTFTSTLALAGDWTLLGSRVVNDRTETDVIPVGADEGAFRRIRLDVGNAPVEFKRIVIHFVNGGEQTIERNFIVAKRGKGVVIDLKGGERRIKRVKFVYEATSPGFKKATLRLYGK